MAVLCLFGDQRCFASVICIEPERSDGKLEYVSCLSPCRISNFVYLRLNDIVLEYYSTFLQWRLSVKTLARVTKCVRGRF
jgi:hypothetical protein